MLRRILRRAVRHAFLLGADKLVLPGLVEESIAVMGDAYPDVVKNRDFISGVITREEERFRQTLRTGLVILEDELAGGRLRPARSDGVQAARHVRLPARGDHRDHRRARGRGRRRGLQRRDGRAAPAGQGSPQGHRRRRRSDRPLPRAGRAVRHDRVLRRRRGRRRRAGARGGARRRPGRRRGRDLHRPHAVLRRVRWPGGRHGDHRERGRWPRGGHRHHLCAARTPPARGPHRTRGDHGRPVGTRRHRHRAAAGHPPQPHRHPRPALGPARACSAST